MTSCPHCLSPVSGGSTQATTCVRCGRPLVDEAGRELRVIDASYERLVRQEESAFQRLLLVGTPLTFALLLLGPAIHAASLFLSVPVLVAVHLVIVRVWLHGPYRALLSRPRRRVLRWTTRLSFFLFGGLGYGVAVMPFAGAVASAFTFASLTCLAHATGRRALQAERDRLPLALWETLLLVALAIALVGAIVTAFVVFGGIFWVAGKLLDVR